jgi:hypothetical protein
MGRVGMRRGPVVTCRHDIERGGLSSMREVVDETPYLSRRTEEDLERTVHSNLIQLNFEIRRTFVSGRFWAGVAFLRDKNDDWLSLDPVLPCSLKNNCTPSSRTEYSDTKLARFP